MKAVHTIFILLILLSSAARAQIFKCTGQNGEKTYTDTPCNAQGLESAGTAGVKAGLKGISPTLTKMGFSPLDASTLPSPLNDIMRIFLSTKRAVAAKGYPVFGLRMNSGSVPAMGQRMVIGRLAAENNSTIVMYENRQPRLAAAFPFVCGQVPECMSWIIYPEIRAAKWCAMVLIVGENQSQQTAGKPSWEEFVVCENGAGNNLVLGPPPGILDAANPNRNTKAADRRVKDTVGKEETVAPAAPQNYYPGR